MPKYGPINHRELVRALRQLVFAGPEVGGKHLHMVKNGRVITLPNPQAGDIGVPLLARLLKQYEISREEWERL